MPIKKKAVKKMVKKTVKKSSCGCGPKYACGCKQKFLRTKKPRESGALMFKLKELF